MRRLILIAMLTLAAGACQPAGTDRASMDGPPPNNSPDLVPEALPPPTAEQLAFRREMVAQSLALHRRLRGGAKLEVDPQGQAVIRVAADGRMGHRPRSLTAIRSASGWRVELVTGSDLCEENYCPVEAPRFFQASARDSRWIDALLADDGFYAQPDYVSYANVLDGEGTYIEVRTPSRRWAGRQFPLVGGKAGQLTDILYRVAGEQP